MKRIALTIILAAIVPLSSAQELAVADPALASPASASVGLAVTGSATITGLQLDLVYSSAHVRSGSAIPAGSGNHRADARDVQPGRTRVVLYSPTNQVLGQSAAMQIPLLLTAASPTGGPDVSVENLRFITADGQTLIPTLRYGTITEWRRTHFTAAERAESGVIGDDKDPDGDGIPNLGELGMASDPRRPDSAQRPTGTIGADTGGERYLSLRFRQLKGQPAAVAAHVEVTPDLRSWTPGPVPAPTGVEDDQSVEMEARIEVGENGSQFLRLKFQRVAPVAP